MDIGQLFNMIQILKCFEVNFWDLMGVLIFTLKM